MALAPPKLLPPGRDGPYVGALLRLCWTQIRERMLTDARAAGFADLQDAHFAVLSYPVPHGVRLSEVARRTRMSRQAANYLVGQLEDLGYLTRAPEPGGTRRLVWLAPRGWSVAETVWKTLEAVEAEWAAEVGAERFAMVMSVLRQMAGEGAAPVPRD